MNSRILSHPLLTGLAAAGLLSTAAPANAELVAFWQFDSTPTFGQTIETRAGRGGALLGGAAITADAGGRTGAAGDRAIAFGVAQQRMHLVDDGFLTAAASGDVMSVSFWVKQTAIRSSTVLSMVIPATLGGRGFQAHAPWSDNNVYFDTGGCCDGTMRINTTGQVFDWTPWVHVALIKNLDAKEIWVNGALVASGSNPAPITSPITELYLGNTPTLGEAVNGMVDDFAIFSNPLTPENVAALAAGGSPLSLPGLAAQDSDGDSLPDAWELRYFATLTQLTGPAQDFDGDGLTNIAEFNSLLKPNSADSDGDGYADGAETNTGVWVSASNTGTSPFNPDTDGDGLKDGAETNTGVYVSATNAGTNPHTQDYDSDLVSDGNEVLYGSNPINPASTPVAPGVPTLLAWWQFNDDANPLIAKDTRVGLTGDLIGGAVYSLDTEGATGAAGDKALLFTPPGQRLNVPNATWINMAGRLDKMTVSYWQKNTGTPSSSAFWFISPSSIETQRGFQAHVPWSNNNIYFDTAGCCATPAQRLNGVPPDGHDWFVWHHYVFLKDGGTKRVYIDGGLVLQTAAGASPLPVDFNRLIIGSDPGASSMSGYVDDFSVFAAALNDADILALATRTKTPLQISSSSDADADGLPDAWEYLYFPSDLTKLKAPPADLDADGSTDANELAKGTTPNDDDTDDDGLKDGPETGTGTWVSASNTGTDPKKADTDGDGFMDSEENNSGNFVSATNPGSNPNLADTDGDGFKDKVEAIYGTNPNSAASKPFTPGTQFLLAHWPFNDNADPAIAKDVVANIVGANTGTYTDDAMGRSGAAGDRAMLYSGSNTVVDAAFMNLAAGFDSMSVSYWQNLNSTGNTSSFWAHSTSLNDRGFQVHSPWSNSRIYFDHAGCCVTNVERIDVALPIDPETQAPVDLTFSWHHFAFVKDGNKKQIWMDGQLLLEGGGSDPIPTDLATLYIGSAANVNYTDGMMDDFAVYAGGLTEAQIVRLAAGEGPAAVLLPPAPPFFITNVTVNGANVTLTWLSTAGAQYTIQSAENATTGPWQTVQSNIPSGGETTTATVPKPAGSRFFMRVLKQ